MNMNEQYHSQELLETLHCEYIGRDGERRTESGPVLKEHFMEVYINDRLAMKLVCIREYLAELVLGRLLTEGIIRSAGEVESLYVCETGRRAKVYLAEGLLEGIREADTGEYVETTPTCCTGNHVLADFAATGAKARKVTSIPWKASQVFALADRFGGGMPLHGQTFATHSCFLAREGELIFQCEDIGRHNALDKAIGYALRHGVDLEKCMVYSSGRIPTDMALKAIRAGIPILASKASPSCEAVELAREYGLTLVCAARRDRMKLFCGRTPEEEENR